MPKLQIAWSQATEVPSNPIQGYEISYKLTSGSTWTSLPFVATTATSYLYDWIGAEFNKMYNFRIRTKYLNNDLFSAFKTVNVNTTPPPPNTFNARTATKTSNSITLFLTGASAVAGIKGHEISYRVVGSTTWIVKPFIVNTSGSISNNTSGLATNTNYEFRVRTRDTFDVWSTSYFEFTEMTLASLPPTTFDDRTVTKNANSITLVLSGANSTVDIKGHEISYRVVGSPTWIVEPFITTGLQPVTYTVSGLVPNTNYEFRIRTQDTLDVWSTYYYEFTESTTSSFQYSRSNSSSLSDPCLLEYGIRVIYTVDSLSSLVPGDIIYTNATLTTIFNGGNSTWKIGDAFESLNYAVTISNTGVIQSIFSCDF